MPGFLSAHTMGVLASLPKEPLGALLSDLIADHGDGRLAESLAAIRERYGLVEVREEGELCLAIPQASWERAQYDADKAWRKARR